MGIYCLICWSPAPSSKVKGIGQSMGDQVLLKKVVAQRLYDLDTKLMQFG